jgi:hypothetical protein
VANLEADCGDQAFWSFHDVLALDERQPESGLPARGRKVGRDRT